MADLQIQVIRRYVPDTQEKIKQRRERIIAILRKYRPYLLTPEDSPLTMELKQPAGEGKHD